jgi:uncharacterized membrane protein
LLAWVHAHIAYTIRIALTILHSCVVASRAVSYAYATVLQVVPLDAAAALCGCCAGEAGRHTGQTQVVLHNGVVGSVAVDGAGLQLRCEVVARLAQLYAGVVLQ